MKNIMINIIVLTSIFSKVISMQQSPLIHQRALFKAARENNLEKVRQILENNRGLDINWQNRRTKNTSLHRAVINKNEEIAYELLIHVAHPSLANKIEFKPMHFAIRNGDTNMIELLVESGADAQEMYFGETLLHYAARNRSYELARILIYECRAEPYAIDDNNNTPYHVAADNGNLGICALIDSIENSDANSEIPSDPEGIDILNQIILQATLRQSIEEYEAHPGTLSIEQINQSQRGSIICVQQSFKCCICTFEKQGIFIDCAHCTSGRLCLECFMQWHAINDYKIFGTWNLVVKCPICTKAFYIPQQYIKDMQKELENEQTIVKTKRPKTLDSYT